MICTYIHFICLLKLEILVECTKMSIARLDDYWVGQGPTHQILRWKQCQDQPLAGSGRLRTIVETFRAPTGDVVFLQKHALAISTFPTEISPTWHVSKCGVPKSHGCHCPCINLNCHETRAIIGPSHSLLPIQWIV